MIKKLIYISIFFIILCCNTAWAETQRGYVQYNGCSYAFKSGDDILFLKQANKNMFLWEKAENLSKKKIYLQEAMRYYFMLLQINKDSIDARIGLGRVYDEMKLDRYAQKHFFSVYNIDSQNAKNNFYFANFYYKRNDLVTALSYYTKAYNKGYADSYFLNYRLGVIYEKLADVEKAKQFYKKAFNLNSKSVELANKIQSLEDLDYSGSQYYLFNK